MRHILTLLVLYSCVSFAQMGRFPFYVPQTTAAVAPLIYDDFESGSFNVGWITTTADTINTPATWGLAAPAEGGTNICKIPAGLRYNLSGAAATEVWAKEIFYSSDMTDPGMEDRALIVRQADEQLMMHLKFSAGWGGLQWYWYRGGDPQTTTIGSISSDTWYTVKYHFVISATVGAIEIWVNGVQKIDLHNINTGTTAMNDLWFGTNSGTSTTRFVDNAGVYSVDPDP